MRCQGKPRKPRITVVPTGSVQQPYVFQVSFPGQGWKNRQYLTWREALHRAGLIRFEDIFQ